MASRPFTIARLAAAAHMSVADVRCYRDRGLLQGPSRQRGRRDLFAYQQEHLDRLKFIKRALACGFTLEDIARFVDPMALVTCGDVHEVIERRLEQICEAGGAGSPAAANLQKLLAACPAVGPASGFNILEAVSSADC